MYLEKMFGLNGKVAIVTGGGRGIGQVIAQGLAEAGAEVVILSRSGAEETVKLIAEAGGKAYDLKADVTDETQVDKALAEILERSGSIDILFNNAGICMHQSTLEATVEEFREVVDINLTGEFIMCRAVGRIMIERGIKGSIINMASMSGTIVNIPQWQVSYNASKAGVIGMTKSMAREIASRGIRVNAVAPGFIETEMMDQMTDAAKEAGKAQIPFGRYGKTEEIANVVAFLASEKASYITGQVICVDGGMAM